uniref:Ribose 1,5-bisphosphate isomerase n=1 Tax=Thermosporothrix sp. COM3 TaxID=2490863 RepID=A0A455SVF4_9CHLR|nr:hypothetical protein KTC_38650 [Thermosporothrix sp. COM3]
MNAIEQRVKKLYSDREHGSRWLVREAICIMHDAAKEKVTEQQEHIYMLREVAREIAQARPAMAALSGAMGLLMVGRKTPAEIAAAAARMLSDYDRMTTRIAQHAAPLLHGSLLTCSISNTVLDVLRACRQQISEVVVMEGRPNFEGRETALILQCAGLKITLITDAQAALFLPRCQAVVVGADSVLEDGTVLNKAGTALVGWAAHGLQIPFYVLCETLKITPRHWNPDEEHWLEEKEPEEVWPDAPEGIAVRNFYFDATPSHLVRHWITEQGTLKRDEIGTYARKIGEAMLALQLAP